METRNSMEDRAFEFKVIGADDKPAIWFYLKNREVQVFPFELYWFLWDCDEEKSFAKGVKARFQILRDEVCGYFQDDAIGSYIIDFNRRLFIESAKSSLIAFADWMLEGKETMYKAMKTDEINRLIIGIKSLVIPKNYFTRFAKEVKIERFCFEFTEPYNCDTHYKITIGDRQYESNLSDWTTSFNKIRIELEQFSMAYLQGSKVELCFEDSPTILKLQNYDLFYNKGIVTKVTIIPDEFIKGPIGFGWCDPKQILRSLYLGLLSLCITETDWFDDGCEGVSWKEFRLASYNKLQSCVIENAILGIKEDDSKYLPRQRIVASVEEMFEDYANLKSRLEL